jgi:hypothetical protein
VLLSQHLLSEVARRGSHDVDSGHDLLVQNSCVGSTLVASSRVRGMEQGNNGGAACYELERAQGDGVWRGDEGARCRMGRIWSVALGRGAERCGGDDTSCKRTAQQHTIGEHESGKYF